MAAQEQLDEAKKTAKELAEQGESPAAIAKVLYDDGNLAIEDVARALYDTTGLNLNEHAVAEALDIMMHEDPGWLLGLSLADVARALGAEDGLDLDADAVAYALFGLNEMPDTAVAAALYASNGLNLSAGEVAGVLFRLDPDAASVAQALGAEYGLHLDDAAIAAALAEAGLEADDDDLSL